MKSEFIDISRNLAQSIIDTYEASIKSGSPVVECPYCKAFIIVSNKIGHNSNCIVVQADRLLDYDHDRDTIFNLSPIALNQFSCDKIYSTDPNFVTSARREANKLYYQRLGISVKSSRLKAKRSKGSYSFQHLRFSSTCHAYIFIGYDSYSTSYWVFTPDVLRKYSRTQYQEDYIFTMRETHRLETFSRYKVNLEEIPARLDSIKQKLSR